MTQTVIDDGIAHWNTGERHTVRITGTAESLLDWYPIALPHDRPGVETLWNTGWRVYPGSQWQETSPGFWSCPVFRHGLHSDGQAGP